MIPVHNRINGVTINADIALANIVTTIVINTRMMHAAIILVPISIFQGSIIRPTPMSPKLINKKARTNLNNLTTKKQMNKDARIISKYVI